MVEAYIVKSKVAETIRGQNMMVSSDAYDTLSMLVASKVKRACERCQANGRKTGKPYDLTQ